MLGVTVRVCTHPLLAELEGTLVVTLTEELHAAALVGGEPSDLTDDIACQLHLDSEFLGREVGSGWRSG